MARAHRILALGVVLLTVGAAAFGCGGKGSGAQATHAVAATAPAQGAVPWPAPADPLPRIAAAGLRPERREQLRYHVHAHLDVFVNGKAVVVPAAIGINIHDPGVHSGKLPDGSTGYGGIALCAKPCISPLHTHDDSGVLHTESATPTPNRLGEFFTEWGVKLTPSCVGGYCRPTSIQVFVEGKRYDGDPRSIELTDRKEIAIVIGTPPKSIPSEAFPSS